MTYRLFKKPVFAGGVVLMLGYLSAAVRRMKRPVSPELMRFHRGEQMAKLRSILRSMLRLEKVSAFELNTTRQTPR